MKTIKITNYSCNDNGTISFSENISNVIDKMIRLTAKLTECYASDIVYDIENLNDAVKGKETYDCLLFFRECGVTACNTEKFDVNTYDRFYNNFNSIQIWRLTHDPSEMETKLIRVNVRKEGF